MMSAGVRIGLFGEFGCGNIGNEASAEAMIQLLRGARPDARISLIARYAESASAIHRLPAVAMTWQDSRRFGRIRSMAWFKAMCKIIDLARMMLMVGHYDIVIVPGMGGIEAEPAVRPWGMAYALFTVAMACRVRRVPFAVVSIGGTVFAHPAGRFFVKHMLRSATYRSYRDHLTKRAVTASGVDTLNDRVWPDVAFALPIPKHVGLSDHSRVVAIGVIEHYGKAGNSPAGLQVRDTYIARLARFALILLDRGFTIRILVADSADEGAAQALATHLSGLSADTHGFVVMTPAHDISGLMNQMNDAAIVIASRYHNLIPAVMIGKPLIAVSHASKDEQLMHDLDLSCYVHNLEELEPEALAEQFAKAWKAKSELAGHIRWQAIVKRSSTLEQFEILRSAVGL
jgi:polysaccharide pyruvyl transferase WcaK-like protein